MAASDRRSGPKEPPHDRRLDHRRRPHPARDRQTSQGRAVADPSAAPGFGGAEGTGRAQQYQYGGGRRRDLGHQLAARAAELRSRPHVGARCGIRHAAASGTSRRLDLLLRLGHHLGEPRRLDDHGRHGRSGGGRRHRDDVDAQPPRRRRRSAAVRHRQPAPARYASADQPGRLRRRHRHHGRYRPRRRRRARARKPAPRRRRDQERPFQQEPRHGAQRGRLGRARPRGIARARRPPPKASPR